MSETNQQIRDLIAVLEDRRHTLQQIYATTERALTQEVAQLGRTSVSALIVAGLVENYYTCLETIFVRISQFFENSLDPARWHSDLLEKMTLAIADTRVPVVSKENFPPLLELLKFRHFKRYYFDLEYDWDRLDFLMVKLRKAHPTVVRDLDRFVTFLEALIESEKDT